MNYTPREIISVLRKVKVLLDGGKRWTHFTMARNKRKQPVKPYADEAVSWDIIGAVIRVAENIALGDEVLLALAHTLKQSGWRNSLMDYNDADSTTWKDVERLVTITIDTYRHR